MVVATTTYDATAKALDYLHDIHPHTTLAPFPLHFPTSHADILTSFRAHLRSLNRPKRSETDPEPKVVAVIDAIVANPGARLPWEKMVQICREEKVWSIVDAAHAIGQQTDLNLSESKPDFWVSVCRIPPFSVNSSVLTLEMIRTVINGCMRNEDVQSCTFQNGLYQF